MKEGERVAVCLSLTSIRILSPAAVFSSLFSSDLLSLIHICIPLLCFRGLEGQRLLLAFASFPNLFFVGNETSNYPPAHF